MRITRHRSAPPHQKRAIRSAGIAWGKKPILDFPGAREALQELARCFARAAVDAMIADFSARQSTLQPAETPVPDIAVAAQDIQAPRARLPEVGFLRFRDIVADRRTGTPGIIPISRAMWYGWIARGRAPKPVKLGNRRVWRIEDVRALVKRLSAGISPESS